MARLPPVPDSRPRILQHLSRHGILNTLNNLLHGARMVGVWLVITEPRHAPPALLIHVALNDPPGEGIAQPLELLPLFFCQVQLGVVCIILTRGIVIAQPDKQPRGGHALVVNVGFGDALCNVLLIGLDGGKVQHELEVNAVFVGGLPLENVLVSAAFVGGFAAGEDESIVAVGQRGQDLVEHLGDAIGELHVLHNKFESLKLELVWKSPKESVVGFVDVLLEVGESFVQGALHQHHAVENQAVKDEERGHLGAVGLMIHDQLAINNGVDMEGIVIILAGEVEVAVLDEVVVVLSVNQVHGLGVVLVLG